MAVKPKRRQAIETAVIDTYAEHQGVVENRQLYQEVSRRIGVQMDMFDQGEPVGQSGTRRSLYARDVRWVQQSLKVSGLLKRYDKGRWGLTAEGRAKLSRLQSGKKLLAFSTRFGIAVWGDGRDVIAGLEEEVTLYLTSPTYPIRRGRNYGKVEEIEYVDWLCGVIEGVVQRLRPGGNVVLNLGQDVFLKGLPARSLYLERLTLALNERFGLYMMDRLIWENPSKPPGPIQWASINRVQLNAGYEFALWFTNDPSKVIADNTKILKPHSPRHQQLIDQGGSFRDEVHSDGAYRLRPGKSFSNKTAGRIPRNVMRYGHSCGSQRDYKRRARGLGLPVHGAPFPLNWARELVRFLTDGKGVAVDNMSGSGTVGLACELEGQPWVMAEQYGEYVRGQALRFESFTGYAFNPEIDRCLDLGNG